MTQTRGDSSGESGSDSLSAEGWVKYPRLAPAKVSRPFRDASRPSGDARGSKQAFAGCWAQLSLSVPVRAPVAPVSTVATVSTVSTVMITATSAVAVVIVAATGAAVAVAVATTAVAAAIANIAPVTVTVAVTVAVAVPVVTATIVATTIVAATVVAATVVAATVVAATVVATAIVTAAAARIVIADDKGGRWTAAVDVEGGVRREVAHVEKVTRDTIVAAAEAELLALGLGKVGDRRELALQLAACKEAAMEKGDGAICGVFGGKHAVHVACEVLGRVGGGVELEHLAALCHLKVHILIKVVKVCLQLVG